MLWVCFDGVVFLRGLFEKNFVGNLRGVRLMVKA